MNKKHLLTILLAFAVSTLMADPPKPPLGKRWVLNKDYSDEFNGSELDLGKWYNYHPTWKGRPPGLFMSSQVSLHNGHLELRGEKMPRDTVVYNWDGSTNTFNVASGIIVSRKQEAFFGYYECRFKAAKTTMSSTFWFSTRQSFPGPSACADRYGLEWDVQECIGREGNFSGSDFAKGMHSNAHFWYTDCEGVKHDIRSPQVRFEMEEIPSEGFNTYGGWWKNENQAVYYLNDGEGKSHSFDISVKSKPFDQPMGMNLASETYPYPWVSLPTDEELADTSKNVCRYDWVRAYTLVDVDAPAVDGENLLENPGFETGDLAHWRVLEGNPAEASSEQVFAGSHALHIGGPASVEQEVNLRSYSTYYLSAYGKIAGGSGPLNIGVLDASGNILASIHVSESSYTRKTFQFTTGSSGIQHKVFCSAPNTGDEGYADNFKLILSNPDGEEVEETVMFHETIEIDETAGEKTAFESLDFQISYTARADREINLRLYNPEQILVAEQKYLALAGFGNKKFVLQLDSVPTGGYDYQLLADIRYLDSTLADTFQTASYVFDLLNPLDLELKILDLRDDSPLPGALVSLDDLVKTSDENGHVYFYDLSAGSRTVQIEKEGFLPFSSDLTALRSDTSISIHLTPLSHVLSIYLSNPLNGKPVTGADISINELTFQSDFNGGLTEPLFSGEYQVKITHERYADKELSLSISKDTIVFVEMEQALANVKFVLKLDNVSLGGASITIGDQTGLTSSIGMASFADLNTKTSYTYRVENQAELLAEASVAFQSDTTIRLNFRSNVGTNSYLEGSLRLYPNPAEDHIRVSGLEETQRFRISDLNGRTLKTGTLEIDGVLDVSELASGIYFLKTGDFPLMKFSIYR